MDVLRRNLLFLMGLGQEEFTKKFQKSFPSSLPPEARFPGAMHSQVLDTQLETQDDSCITHLTTLKDT